MSRPTLRWPILVLGGVLLSVAAGTVTGALVSNDYWGYVFGPPPMFAEVDTATEVRRFTAFAVEPGKPAATSAMPGAERQREARVRRYYLEQSRTSPLSRRLRTSFLSAPPDPTLDVGAVVAMLWKAGILVEGEKGYETQSHALVGAAIELAEATGGSMLVLTFMSGEVSNDHHARYEVLLTRAGGAWQVQRWQRHFYDIAGAEFLEGPVLFVLATVISTAFYLVLLGGAIAIVVKRSRQQRPATVAPGY